MVGPTEDNCIYLDPKILLLFHMRGRVRWRMAQDKMRRKKIESSLCTIKLDYIWTTYHLCWCYWCYDYVTQLLCLFLKFYDMSMDFLTMWFCWCFLFWNLWMLGIFWSFNPICIVGVRVIDSHSWVCLMLFKGFFVEEGLKLMLVMFFRAKMNFTLSLSLSLSLSKFVRLI